MYLDRLGRPSADAVLLLAIRLTFTRALIDIHLHRFAIDASNKPDHRRAGTRLVARRRDVRVRSGRRNESQALRSPQLTARRVC